MAARGQYPVMFREKLRLETTLSSQRHLSASLPLISLFLPPAPFFPLFSLPHSSLFYSPFSQAWSEVSALAQPGISAENWLKSQAPG